MASSLAFAIIKLSKAIINTFGSDYSKDSLFAFRGLVVCFFMLKDKKNSFCLIVFEVCSHINAFFNILC